MGLHIPIQRHSMMLTIPPKATILGEGRGGGVLNILYTVRTGFLGRRIGPSQDVHTDTSTLDTFYNNHKVLWKDAAHCH
jgi:hypothetical protein